MQALSRSFPRVHRLARAASHLVLALCCGAAVQMAQAGTVPFTAVVEGTSTIVEVLDPQGPVVRVQTQASGSGSPGLLAYFSGDVLHLGTGQGSGSNRFVNSAGDELLGSFTVQMVPGPDASLFELIGDMVIQGGTGQFLGAAGSLGFVGTGQFFSASQAHTRFVFEGSLTTVPEPSTTALLALAMLGLLALRRGELPGRGRPSGHPSSHPRAA